MRAKKWTTTGLVLLFAAGIGYIAVRAANPAHDGAKTISVPKHVPPSKSMAAPATSARPPVLDEKTAVKVYRPKMDHDERLFSAIEGNDKVTLDSAIRQAISRRGRSDPRIAGFVDRASSICSSDPDPGDTSNPAMQDATRLWAVKRVMDLCRGFDPAG